MFVQLSPTPGIFGCWTVWLSILLHTPTDLRFGQCSREGRSCPAVPWQARGAEGGWETQAGATLFFFFLGIETLSNYCEE